MEIKVATRQCRDQAGVPRQFHYFLTVEDSGDNAVIPAITTSAARIDELMTLLVDHCVGPAGLADVVADWL